MSRRASPFDALLGLQPEHLPETAQMTVVISGRRVTDPIQLDQLLDEDDPMRTRLRHAMACRDSAARRPREGKKVSTSQRAWYQAHRQELLARQRAWYQANRETVLAKQRIERAAKKAAVRTAAASTTDERKDA